jgi:hypothetical protein
MMDDLAASIEQLVSCSMRKGSHLQTKVRIICDMMLTMLFDGKCQTYLLHKAKGLVQRENPYHRVSAPVAAMRQHWLQPALISHNSRTFLVERLCMEDLNCSVCDPPLLP